MNDSIFEQALKDLPSCTGLDGQKTVEDLCWICLHELDLVAEGEYWHPVATRRKLLNFCKKYGFYVDEAQEQFDLARGMRKSDCAACD